MFGAMVEAVLRQTIDDFELIIVNDGSNDNTQVILEEYTKRDPRIVAINKQNGGLSSARNSGIEAARGEFITFVDDDDIIRPDYLESMLEEDMANYDLIIDSYSNQTDNNKPIQIHFPIRKLNSHDAALKYVFRELQQVPYCFFAVAKRFKLSIIRKYNIRFSSTIKFVEDRPFVLDYLRHSSFPSGNEQIEISTAYGEQKRLVLPDSSEVWLNAGSTITYPKTFTKENRVVTLDGEAYFSVRKDDAKPFIVETSQLSVKVLGTKFNVKAYANDGNITTTLTSGKVEVSTQSRPPQTLKPNERLTYDKSTSDIEISTVDTVDTNSWVKGKIIFTNATAEEIFRTLERRYDTVIDHSADFSASRRYTVKFLKDENLDEMLNILGDIIGFSYRQSGNKIIITK